MPKQEYDNNNRGYIAKNKDREKDTHPSHKGKLTVGLDTLKALIAMAKAGEEPIIYMSGWPSKKPGMLNIQLEAPKEYREEGDNYGKKTARGKPYEEDRPQRPRRPTSRFTEEEDDDDLSDPIPF